MTLLGFLLLMGTLASAGSPRQMAVYLQPPGLRLVQDPSEILPPFYRYSNQSLFLPSYTNSQGKPEPGWASEIIKTRSFASHQSARLYYRTADLDQSIHFQAAGPLEGMRVWPEGALLILEVYDGDGSLMDGARPVEIAAMAKSGHYRQGSSSVLYSMDWSYGLFGPKGEPRLLPEKVEECHRCHSIAFYLTGDLIFTRFPGAEEIPPSRTEGVKGD
jgi:hypothetical protein